MKKQYFLLYPLVMGVFFVLASSCEKDLMPVVTTTAISNIIDTTATSGGDITDEGSSTVISRGVCWSTGTSPTINDNKTTDGAGAGSYSSTITELNGATDYYVRAYATNSEGTGYGMALAFTTKEESTGTFIDVRDNKEYRWVRIGEQKWMAENLAFLPSVSPSTERSSSDPYYYVYGYEDTSVSESEAISNYQIYGVLYNWPAAINACPSGWHLPTDEEWKIMEMHLGMSQAQAYGKDFRGTNEGGKLKEAGATHWRIPNTGATNESGFTALPGGNCDGGFNGIGSNGDWWSATESDSDHAWRRRLNNNGSYVYRGGYYKITGFSVRCLKD